MIIENQKIDITITRRNIGIYKNRGFDFYLPDYHICIEYDGEGHYMPIKRGNMTEEQATEVFESIKCRDEIKNIYCDKNRIQLLRIPYWEFNNINDILYKELFT